MQMFVLSAKLHILSSSVCGFSAGQLPSAGSILSGLWSLVFGIRYLGSGISIGFPITWRTPLLFRRQENWLANYFPIFRCLGKSTAASFPFLPASFLFWLRFRLGFFFMFLGFYFWTGSCWLLLLLQTPFLVGVDSVFIFYPLQVLCSSQLAAPNRIPIPIADRSGPWALGLLVLAIWPFGIGLNLVAT